MALKFTDSFYSQSSDQSNASELEFPAPISPVRPGELSRARSNSSTNFSLASLRSRSASFTMSPKSRRSSFAISKDSFVYKVSFKISTKDFILSPDLEGDVFVGCSVIVAVDKKGSEDLGIITEIQTLREYLSANYTLIPLQFKFQRHAQIIRIATLGEIRTKKAMMQEEFEILEYAQYLSRNVYNLDVVIQAVEFQFDRRRLTVYYDSKNRVDFKGFDADILLRFSVNVRMMKIKK